MANKIRFFVRLDSQHKPVVGSNLSRAKKPKSGVWQEIFPPNCCNIELRYTPVDVTGTGVDLTLSCDTDTIFAIRAIGSVTTVATVVSVLNDAFGNMISFTADGSDVVATINTNVFGSLCDGQLSFTAEAA